MFIQDSRGETFNVSEARNLGCEKAIRSGIDVLIVADADTVFLVESVRDAIEIAVETGLVCHPYTRIVDLDTEESLRFQRGHITFDEALIGKHPQEKHPGSGWVMTAQTFWTLNGWDERFVGWGFEDNAFGEAHKAVLGKVVRRSYGRCFKMNHDERDVKSLESNREAFNQYKFLAKHKDLMLEHIAGNRVR
jgi:hypothetical protein